MEEIINHNFQPWLFFLPSVKYSFSPVDDSEVQNLFWYTYCVDFFDLYRKLFNLSLNIFVFYFFVITVYMLNKTFLLSVYLAPSPAEAPHCSVVF